MSWWSCGGTLCPWWRFSGLPLVSLYEVGRSSLFLPLGGGFVPLKVSCARTANLQRVIRACTKRDQQKPCQSYESFWSGLIAMVWIANF
ncbi:hypothetical protein N665_0109s0054 [Sinapis alba]|nr:hypothetical protein N665_0109s0054 [Sinapis alba]